MKFWSKTKQIKWGNYGKWAKLKRVGLWGLGRVSCRWNHVRKSEWGRGAFLIRTWVQKGLSFVSGWRGQCYFIGSYPLFFPFLLNDLHTELVLLLVSIAYRSTIVVQNGVVFVFFFWNMIIFSFRRIRSCSSSTIFRRTFNGIDGWSSEIFRRFKDWTL